MYAFCKCCMGAHDIGPWAVFLFPSFFFFYYLGFICPLLITLCRRLARTGRDNILSFSFSFIMTRFSKFIVKLQKVNIFINYLTNIIAYNCRLIVSNAKCYLSFSITIHFTSVELLLLL